MYFKLFSHENSKVFDLKIWLFPLYGSNDYESTIFEKHPYEIIIKFVQIKIYPHPMIQDWSD